MKAITFDNNSKTLLLNSSVCELFVEQKGGNDYISIILKHKEIIKLDFVFNYKIKSTKDVIYINQTNEIIMIFLLK